MDTIPNHWWQTGFWCTRKSAIHRINTLIEQFVDTNWAAFTEGDLTCMFTVDSVSKGPHFASLVDVFFCL